MEKLKEQVESQINSVIEEGISPENVDYIYRLIDIHKDIANEEYWKKKEEMYMYRNSGYGNYGRDNYGRGNYGAKDGTMKSLEYMLQSVTEFLEMLKQDANSQEEMQLIQEYTRHISEM